MSYVNRFEARTGNNALVGAYGVEALSDDRLMRLAPSIFAEDRHESRSDRYTYIPTSEIVVGMRREGFVPVEARQGKCRVEGKEDFTKHLVRFMPAGQPIDMRRVGGLVPTVTIINSHDGTSAYKVLAGLLRLVCLNGMLASDKDLANFSVPHKGDIVSNVIDASFEIVKESGRAIEQADAWSGITLDRDERLLFAEASHLVRFGDSEGEVTTTVRPDQLLVPRRHDDRGEDLWRTTNVIQENCIRGNLHGVGRDANGRTRRSTTKPVRGIDGDVKINRALWMLAERMAELKAA